MSKWSALYQVLDDIVPPLGADVNFGLELFPYDPLGIDTSSPDSSCGVPEGTAAVNVDIGQGTTHAIAINDYLRTYTPAGGTPTSKALLQAYNYFAQGSGKCLRKV